jgi:hypothetical protein
VQVSREIDLRAADPAHGETMTPAHQPPPPCRAREGGERTTRRTTRPQPPDDQSSGRDDAAPADDDDDMDQWVKQVADALPPLTDRQRDRLARLLRPPRQRAA